MQQHLVKCLQSKVEFDAAREAHWVLPAGKSQRYLRAICADQYFNDPKNVGKKETAEFVDPENDIICPFCKKKVIKADGIRLPGGWYSHKECYLVEEQREKTPEENLNLYIMKIYDIPFVSPYMKRQIERYREEYQYTYTGMLRSLKYWYEIEHHEVDKTKGVGIIPYIYQQAYNYYYAIWAANHQTAETIIQKQVENISISAPSPPQYFKKLFTSVDKDEINAE